MRIAEAAHRFSIPRHHIDYWRKSGLLSSGGAELDFQDLKKIRFILECKKNRISLRKIRSILRGADDSRGIAEKESALPTLLIHDSGDLLIKEENFLVQPGSGQLFMEFAPREMTGRLLELRRPGDGGASGVRDDDEIPGLEERFQEAIATGNPDSLKELLEGMLEDRPEHLGALIEMGNLSFEEELYDEALDYYGRAIQVDPNCVEAHYNVANIYFKQKKYAAAIRSFHRCIDLDPEFPESYFNLGIVYYSLKYLDRAEAFFRMYLELDGDSVWADQARQLSEDIRQLQDHAERTTAPDLFTPRGG